MHWCFKDVFEKSFFLRWKENCFCGCMVLLTLSQSIFTRLCLSVEKLDFFLKYFWWILYYAKPNLLCEPICAIMEQNFGTIRRIWRAVGAIWNTLHFDLYSITILLLSYISHFFPAWLLIYSSSEVFLVFWFCVYMKDSVMIEFFDSYMFAFDNL